MQNYSPITPIYSKTFLRSHIYSLNKFLAIVAVLYVLRAFFEGRYGPGCIVFLKARRCFFPHHTFGSVAFNCFVQYLRFATFTAVRKTLCASCTFPDVVLISCGKSVFFCSYHYTKVIYFLYISRMLVLQF